MLLALLATGVLGFGVTAAGSGAPIPAAPDDVLGATNIRRTNNTDTAAGSSPPVKSGDAPPWSGPSVRNAWQRGFPRFSIDGALSLPHWLYPAPGESGDLAIQAAAKVGIEVITVQVRLASPLEASSTGMAQIRRVLSLHPEAKILLRVQLGAWVNETAAMMVLRDASGAALPCKAGACAAVNSWTSSWISRTSTALESMLSQIDSTFQGRVFGVWLTAGVSGEWNYGTNADYTYFPDYNPALVREFCAVAGCADAPNISSRDAANLGDRFITSDTADGAAVVAWNRFLNGRVTTAISALCNATKHVSGGKAWCGAFHGCERSQPPLRSPRTTEHVRTDRMLPQTSTTAPTCCHSLVTSG